MHGLSDRLMHWLLICLVQVQLRTEVLRTPSSTRAGFELDHDLQIMTVHFMSQIQLCKLELLDLPSHTYTQPI